jgi:hypothetical protein
MGLFDRFINTITFGAVDRSDAEDIVNDANDRRDRNIRELESAKKITNEDIVILGELKQKVYQESISDFVKNYKVIGKVDLKPLKENNYFDYSNFKTNLVEMKIVTTKLEEVGATIGGGALTGATAAFGAMGTAALIGTASTGTAIGTLSGVAATNATLAWLGGGAISAGGLGVAGGMAVLGGIVLAPIAIFGMFLGANKGKQVLNNANNYSDEINVMIEKIKTLIAELSQIRRGSDLMSNGIQGLDSLLRIYNAEMKKIAYRLEQRTALSKFFIDPIKNKIFNISILTDQEAEIFAISANIASMLSEIIRMPLMNQEGAFVSQTLEELDIKQPQIQLLLNQK